MGKVREPVEAVGKVKTDEFEVNGTEEEAPVDRAPLGEEELGKTGGE